MSFENRLSCLFSAVSNGLEVHLTFFCEVIEEFMLTFCLLIYYDDHYLVLVLFKESISAFLQLFSKAMSNLQEAQNIPYFCKK